MFAMNWLKWLTPNVNPKPRNNVQLSQHIERRQNDWNKMFQLERDKMLPSNGKMRPLFGKWSEQQLSILVANYDEGVYYQNIDPKIVHYLESVIKKYSYIPQMTTTTAFHYYTQKNNCTVEPFANWADWMSIHYLIELIFDNRRMQRVSSAYVQREFYTLHLDDFKLPLSAEQCSSIYGATIEMVKLHHCGRIAANVDEDDDEEEEEGLQQTNSENEVLITTFMLRVEFASNKHKYFGVALVWQMPTRGCYHDGEDVPLYIYNLIIATPNFWLTIVNKLSQCLVREKIVLQPKTAIPKAFGTLTNWLDEFINAVRWRTKNHYDGPLMICELAQLSSTLDTKSNNYFITRLMSTILSVAYKPAKLKLVLWTSKEDKIPKLVKLSTIINQLVMDGMLAKELKETLTVVNECAIKFSDPTNQHCLNIDHRRLPLPCVKMAKQIQMYEPYFGMFPRSHDKNHMIRYPMLNEESVAKIVKTPNQYWKQVFTNTTTGDMVLDPDELLEEGEVEQLDPQFIRNIDDQYCMFDRTRKQECYIENFYEQANIPQPNAGDAEFFGWLQYPALSMYHLDLALNQVVWHFSNSPSLADKQIGLVHSFVDIVNKIKRQLQTDTGGDTFVLCNCDSGNIIVLERGLEWNNPIISPTIFETLLSCKPLMNNEHQNWDSVWRKFVETLSTMVFDSQYIHYDLECLNIESVLPENEALVKFREHYRSSRITRRLITTNEMPTYCKIVLRMLKDLLRAEFVGDPAIACVLRVPSTDTSTDNMSQFFLREIRPPSSHLYLFQSTFKWGFHPSVYYESRCNIKLNDFPLMLGIRKLTCWAHKNSLVPFFGETLLRYERSNYYLPCRYFYYRLFDNYVEQEKPPNEDNKQ